MARPLIRGGADAYLLPGGATEATAQAAIQWHKGHDHTAVAVFGEMQLQVMQDYACLPDPYNMPLCDIVYFYAGRRGALKQSTAPKK